MANVGAFGAADSIDDSVLIPRLSQRTLRRSIDRRGFAVWIGVCTLPHVCIR